MATSKGRYRVAIYATPGFNGAQDIRSQLGKSIRAAGGRKAQYVVIGCGGVDVVVAWYKQAKAVLHPGSQVTNVKEDEVSWREIRKKIDPDIFLYFSKGCEGVQEHSKMLTEQGIDHTVHFTGQGKRE